MGVTKKGEKASGGLHRDWERAARKKNETAGFLLL